MGDTRERAELVALAERLETLAEDGGDEFDVLLRQFNERARATTDRDTFRYLYESEDPKELVERVLEIRDAPPFVLPRTREELLVFTERADAKGAAYVDLDRAGEALAHMSRLPRDLAHQLGSGFGTLPCWPPREEILEFALGYQPATTLEDLRPLLRRWIEDSEADRTTIYAAVGEALLRERHAALRLSELDAILKRLDSGIDVQRAHAMKQLKKLFATGDPTRD